MDKTSSTVVDLIEGSSALETGSSIWRPISDFLGTFEQSDSLLGFIAPFVTLAKGAASLLGLIA
ncbi:hypothetical protein [Corynebacterium sanguinis]|uniref:hypothetical protein n=1 Tax=Corynebacterium sanguinis TaxID=2594913 RepID=UPI0010AA76B6|nr:hypothetical protein [Corynebacterium sanguinis]MCT1411549.1 hypothetical protein [Corynebacterium sanguinis]MCT2154364.1 hypothetical protein [Corynebacterium sanguinis]